MWIKKGFWFWKVFQHVPSRVQLRYQEGGEWYVSRWQWRWLPGAEWRDLVLPATNDLQSELAAKCKLERALAL